MEFWGIFGVIVVIAIIALAMRDEIDSSMSPDERKYREVAAVIAKWGPISPAYICPHCQTKGFVRTIPVKRKKGVSGAKATGALLTMGVSMLLTGLSRKEGLTQATCGNCGSTWDF
jgi:hypothetical protein